MRVSALARRPSIVVTVIDATRSKLRRGYSYSATRCDHVPFMRRLDVIGAATRVAPLRSDSSTHFRDARARHSVGHQRPETIARRAASAAQRTVVVISTSEPATEPFQSGWKALGVVVIAW